MQTALLLFGRCVVLVYIGIGSRSKLTSHSDFFREISALGISALEISTLQIGEETGIERKST